MQGMWAERVEEREEGGGGRRRKKRKREKKKGREKKGLSVDGEGKMIAGEREKRRRGLARI